MNNFTLFLFLYCLIGPVSSVFAKTDGRCGKAPLQGPPGLPATSDWAFYVVQTDVIVWPLFFPDPSQTRFPFISSGVAPSSTKISLNTSTNQITIADTGSYFVSVTAVPGSNRCCFGLSINDSPFNQNYAVSVPSIILGQQFSLAVIINVTTNPTTLSVTNFSSNLLDLSPPSDHGTPNVFTNSAWITIIKLQ